MEQGSATIFQALCSKVTIVEKGPHLLGPMDEEVSEALKEQLVKKGITVYCNAMVEEIQRKVWYVPCAIC